MGPLLAFTALIVFMGHWGWNFVAFTVFVLLMECFGFDVCGIHSVYGSLVWDPCGIHSVCRFMRRLGCSLFVAFRVFVTFMGHWGGTLVAFAVFVLCMECSGWKFVASTAFVASMRHSGLVLLVTFRVFVVFMGHWR